MKRTLFLLLILVTLGFYGCRKDHTNEFYFNRKGVIVAMNGNDETFTQDKFKTPVTCALVLIRDAADTTMFMQLSSCYTRSSYKRLIDSEWYYNHEIGDSVHFDYIRKDRYFHIYPKK